MESYVILFFKINKVLNIVICKMVSYCFNICMFLMVNCLDKYD